MLSSLFPTVLLHERPEIPAAELNGLAEYVMTLRGMTAGEKMSNRGGWHSSGNLFAGAHPPFPAVREAITRGILSYSAEVFSWRGDVQFRLAAWAVVNRANDYNAPHTHAPNALSGALYLRIPQEMKEGQIVFTDPRHAVNFTPLSQAAAERGQRLPWTATEWVVTPSQGDLLIFPSWLNHFVHAFQATDPEDVRIVLSFNASF